MYGKVFDSMYDGTLYGQWEALVTFQQLIVLCDADGIVDMTPPAIAARTSIPLEIITKGLATLEAPDPYSRTPDQGGCRIELIDAHRPWGWHIVNHDKYQHMQDSDTIREQTRERVRRHREQKRLETQGNAKVTPVTDGNAPKRHTDTDTDTDKRKSKAFAPQASLSDVDPKLVSDWLRVRKEKKAATTETAIAAVRREAEKAGLTMQEAVKLCCENSWAGFKASWPRDGNGSGQPRRSLAESLAEDERQEAARVQPSA